MGCCVFAIILAGAPRFAFIMWWLFQPGRVSDGFDTIIFPLLGVLFAPWTTLMWVIVYPGGISMINWAFLAIALIVDLGTYFGGGKSGRDRYSK